MGVATNTTLQSIQVVKELMNQDNVEVELVDSEYLKEIEKGKTLLNSFILYNRVNGTPEYLKNNENLPNSLFWNNIEDVFEVEWEGISSKDLFNLNNYFIVWLSKLLDNQNNLNEKIGNSFADFISTMKVLEYNSYSTTPTKKREGSKEGYYHKSVAKRRSKSKQAKKSRRKNRK